MQEQRPGSSTATMLGLLAVAAVYGAVVRVQPDFTGYQLLDGAIGIGLGLYICSHPAAAMIDVLYQDRAARRRHTGESLALAWVSLNLLVMVAGSIVTSIGTTRFVG